MRIQGREDSYITKYPKGIFSLCWNLIRDKKMTPEDEQLFISIDNWFKDNLPEPEPCKNHETVITFFKCENAEHMIKKIESILMLSTHLTVDFFILELPQKLLKSWVPMRCSEASIILSTSGFCSSTVTYFLPLYWPDSDSRDKRVRQADAVPQNHLTDLQIP